MWTRRGRTARSWPLIWPQRVRRETRPARRRRGCSSHRSSHPGSSILLSQHHSTALPSPKRYDERYEARFLSRVEPSSRRLTCQRDKRCMLVSMKLGADFSRGCAHPAMQPPISATHPPLLDSRISSPEASGWGLAWLLHSYIVRKSFGATSGRSHSETWAGCIVSLTTPTRSSFKV